jgi:RimJ/RimL family protein N-acetyltransferase
VTVELATDRAGLVVRALRPADATAVHALLHADRAHLTRNGDFTDEVDVSEAILRERFDQDPARPLAFGVVEHERLVGTVTLVPVEPPRYGLGYWLAEDATGRGVGTAAVSAVLRHAADIGATDVFAGVTHGNAASIALLHRTGFEHVADFETYARFHRGL